MLVWHSYETTSVFKLLEHNRHRKKLKAVLADSQRSGNLGAQFP
jgi:hypothetical protein